MHISAIPVVTAASATDSTDPHAPGQAKAADPAKSKAAEEAVQAKKEFIPAPPLRPNIQDVVDINRVLIKMRGL